jgi:hypothetical protein
MISPVLSLSAIGSAQAQAAIDISMFGRAKNYRKDQK